jgi:hypothetical protein
MRVLTQIALIGAFAFGLSAARITLRDGTVVYGNFVSGSAQTIVIQDQSGMRHRFDVNQVQLIDFGDRNGRDNERDRQYTDRDDERYDQQQSNVQPQMNQQQQQQYAEQQRQYDQQQHADQQYPPRADGRSYGNRFASIAAGTQISVRTDESINSENASEGRTFNATIAQDVLDNNGRVAIPRGSTASLVIRRVNEGGALSNGSFILDLDSVNMNGRTYLIASSDVKASDANGIGANRRTGEMVGGGAVLGTLLGAIAGGGKGAAIGAAAGAAAGGGVEVLTKGHSIRVPAETMLNFRLDRPLELREAH